MMKTFKTLVVPVALIGVFALPSLAQADSSKTVNQRQERQEDRIRDGVRSGQLTEREAADLQARVARVRTQETYARRSGGVFTDAEKRGIQNQLDAIGRDIDRQKHDHQTVYNGHNYAGSINQRQGWQQRQIRHGERDGALTEREAADLQAREARIRTQEAYLRRSGNQLTPAERARLQRELNAEHRAIEQQTHDAQHRR